MLHAVLPSRTFHMVITGWLLCGLMAGCGDDSQSTADIATDMTTPDSVGPADVQPDLPPEVNELLIGTRVTFGHVIDGDTLDVYVGTRTPKAFNVRMRGLAAPECTKQAIQTENFGRRWQCTSDDEYYGLASREELVSILAGKSGVITCDDVQAGGWCPTDPYDRFLVYIEVDGVDVATEMARRGAGLSYTSFDASKRAPICEAEYAAQGGNRGMWSGHTVSQVINMMSQQTQNWYFGHHDTRCDAALGL